MEIKKADSKGRVTGLEKGRYYRVHRLEGGEVVFTLMADIQKAIQTLNSFEAR